MQQVVETDRLDVDVEKVESMERMIELGILATPGVAVDGKVVLSGRIPKAEEIREDPRRRAEPAGPIPMKERTKLLVVVAVFAAAYVLPVESPRVQKSFLEGLFLLKEYAQQHVLLCLVPALFIAGAIGQFLSQAAVMRYLGARASRPVAYGVASVSGSILAVCSCTVLPLFAGIYAAGPASGRRRRFSIRGRRSTSWR